MSRKERKDYLTTDDVDSLGRMVNALLSELWITRDRVAVLEKMLEDAGVLRPAAIDEFVPDGEFAERLDRLRATMIENVAGAPFTQDGRTVEALARRATR